MNIFQGFKGIFRRGKKNVKAQTLADRFRSWFDPLNIFSSTSANILATNETIFAAVSILSNAMASLPLKLLINSTPIVDSNVADLLINNPNPNMNGFEFIRVLETYRNTTGNGYAMMEYDTRYQVKALWILDSSKVTPLIESKSKELWYKITGDKNNYYVHNLDMIHVKHIHSTGYKGINPISVLTNTIDFDTKVKQFSLDQMDGAVKASFILQMAAHLGTPERNKILASFKSFYEENGGVLIQDIGTVITPIDRKFIDTKVFEAEKITRTRVASVYNMPAHMLGETDGSSFSSMEQMALEFVQSTLMATVIQYEKEFNRKLLPVADRKKGQYWKFNLNVMLRGDTKTRSDFYFKGIRTMMFKPNEVRALEDLPPVEGGDTLYVSGDLYPIDQERIRK